MNKDLRDIIYSIKRWSRYILGVTAVAFLLSVIVVLLLPVWYQAETVFYAASEDMSKPEKIFGMSQGETQYYGNEDDINRLRTIGYSSELIYAMVDSFSLYTRYGIDRNSRKARYKVSGEFLDHYKLEKTERDALRLSVEDKDPVVAAAMANVARDEVVRIIRKLIRQSMAQLLTTYEKKGISQSSDLREIQDSLSLLRKQYGIYDPEGQLELAGEKLMNKMAALRNMEKRLNVYRNTRGVPRDTIIYLEAAIEGVRAELDVMQSDSAGGGFNMRSLNEGLGKVTALEQLRERLEGQLGHERIRKDLLRSATTADFPVIHIVEYAGIPEIKHRPRRALIVLGVTISVFILSVFIALAIDAYYVHGRFRI